MAVEKEEERLATPETPKSVFDVLYSTDVNKHVKPKGRLKYLSWAWAWAYVKLKYPDASYTVYEDSNGNLYHTDGRTCWVKTGVTINNQEYIEYLPIMDMHNQSIPVDKVTSFDANRAVQRSITKACARHGLGLYIYAGEDLPDGIEDGPQSEASEAIETPAVTQQKMLAAEAKGAVDVMRRLFEYRGISEGFACHMYGIESLDVASGRMIDNMAKHIDDIKKRQDESDEKMKNVKKEGKVE